MSPTSSSSPLLVQGLFVSTCFLSVVSWYTTYQGMALYLSPWFAFLASLGIQSALVLVAWLAGSARHNKALLGFVYGMTALVSIAFSYVSLYTWFSSKERPAIVERQLYDTISASSGKASELLTAAIAEAEKHALALEEMTKAERSQGFAARAEDADPYLKRVREAVAQEAQSGYREGAGAGVRYAAFERYTKLAQKSLAQLQDSRRALQEFRAALKPGDPSEQQIRQYRAVYDAIPWSEVEAHLNKSPLARPEVPALSDHLDKTSTGQEELLLAFTELLSAPTARHIFSFSLATFIDVIVFLLAFSAGPHFAGSPGERWRHAGAAVDDTDQQLFARDLLRKVESDGVGLARIPLERLSPGERQFCMMLASKGLAVLHNGYYVLDEKAHEELMEAMVRRQLPLRASAAAPSPVNAQ